MPGFNVSEFRSVIAHNNGLMRTNRFMVDIPVPRKLRGKLGKEGNTPDSGVMSFYCKSAPIPGIGILTQDIYRYGYGPIERKPYGVVVNDAMLQFYVDGKNIVRTWFDNWVRLIVNKDARQGFGDAPPPPAGKEGVPSSPQAAAYDFAYKNDYAVDMTINSFDPEGRLTTTVVLVEAYPNFIGDILLDWDDKNNNMILPVSMTFRDWYEETIK